MDQKTNLLMSNRMTDRARKVMAFANQEAQRLNCQQVDTEHILLGLTKEGNGVGVHVLKDLGIDLRALRTELESGALLHLSPSSEKVLQGAIDEAMQLHHNYVGTEHILLGLLSQQAGVAAQVLASLDVKPEEVRRRIVDLVSHSPGGGSRHEPSD